MAHRENRNEESIRNASLLAHHNPQSEIAEHYRHIRNNIRFAAGRDSIGKLVVTSPAEGDGKTTLAVNLAVTMAQQGGRVLLIDANIKNPDLHLVFNVKSWPGLSDVLAGQSALDDTIKPCSVDGLYVLPGGSGTLSTADRLDSGAMDELLERAGQEYDAVVLDCPPVFSASAVSLASRADGALLVVDRKAKHNAVQEAAERLEFANVRLLGTVLNRSRK